MGLEFTPEQEMLKSELLRLMKRFDDRYWREKDEKWEFPQEFFEALAENEYFGITIPEEYGGAGLGLVEGCIVVEEITRAGAGFNGSQAVHTNIFGIEPIIKYGTEDQKQKFLGPIARGECMMAVAITEPDAGFDTLNISTRAVKEGNGYILNGRKTFLSRFKESKTVLIVTRTTPLAEASKKTLGISLFVAETDDPAFEAHRIKFAGRHSVPSYDLSIDNLYVPEENLIGEEGQGFYHLLNVLNPERISVAAECVGLGRLALERAVDYAKERVVFGRPIGMNQAIQFPLAESHMKLEAARMMIYHAARLYDEGKPCGEEANTAKYLAAEAAYRATENAVQTMGGYGYAMEQDVERYWREARLTLIAPISQEMILNYIGSRVLELPRSY